MNKRVLLIDADAAFAERAAHAFADADVALEAVAEAGEAIHRARIRKPDLLVLGDTPAGDGFSLCNRLREVDELGDVPVVILADDAVGDAVQAHRVGPTAADLYLERPGDPDGLVAAVGPRLGIEIDAVGDDEILALDDLEGVELPGEPLAELEQTVVGLRKELAEERGRVAALESELADTRTRATSISQVLDESLADREESDRAWTARVAQAEGEAAAAREEADRARLEAARARGEAEAARRETEEARAEAEAARAEADAAKIDAVVARGETEAANHEVEALRGELAEARGESDELLRELEEAKAQLVELAAARAAGAGAAGGDAEAGLAEELAAMRARNEELAAELAAARARHDELARERSTRGAGGPSGDAGALARELAEVRAERERMQDELAAELSNLAHDLAVREGQMRAAQRKITRLEGLVRGLQQERDRLAAAAKATPAGDAALELARLREELEDLRNENAFLGTEVERYAAEARELREQQR